MVKFITKLYFVFQYPSYLCVLIFLEYNIVCIVWNVVPMLMVVPMVVVVPIVASEDMPRLDIPMVMMVMRVHRGWKVMSMTHLRVHRGCVVGRGCLHRRGGSSSCSSSQAGEDDSKEHHDSREDTG